MTDIPRAFVPLLLQEAQIPLSLPLAFVLFFAGLAGYALVNAVEIAIVAASRIRVRAAAAEGSQRAKALARLQGDQESFFGAIVILQNVFVVLLSSAGAVISVDLFGRWGFLFLLSAVPLISTEFGEYTPKVFASRTAERIAFAIALPVELLVRVMRPVTAALAVIPNLFLGARVSQTVTEAELRMLIDIGAEEGAVTEDEAELLDRVFHFHDRRVNEIMVPRPEVVWLERGETVRDLLRTFEESPHSRFPVYHDTVDNVVGTVSIKDVLRSLAAGADADSAPLAPLIRPAAFVPETKLVSALFWQMQEERRQMAVIVDEYGGVAGIVTLELLIEEMVGDVSDEERETEEEYDAIDERTTRVDGGMSIFDLREELDVALPDGDYETVAGFVLEQLGHIPREGETVTLDGYRIAVSEVNGVKIESVVITKLPA
jgi:putative hemolysin